MGKRKTYCDYAFAVKDFRAGLIKLRDHIHEHDLIVDGPEVCAELDQAIAFLGGLDDLPWGKDGEAQWQAGWDFIRDHIRSWWD